MTRLLNTSELFDSRVLDNPYAFLDRLRRADPVHRLADTGFFVVTPRALIAEVQTRAADFSSNLTSVLAHDADGRLREFAMDARRDGLHVLATADDPLHRTHRKLVLPTLIAKRIAALEPMVTGLADRFWNDGCDRKSIEWMSAIADRLPLTLVSHLIGLPESDVPLLLEWSYTSTELLSGVVTTDRLPHTTAAAVQLAGYLAAAFATARRSPRDDLLGDLVRACETGELRDHEAVLILVQLVGAGGESTAALLGSAAHHLAADLALQEQLRADPQLVAPFLEEVLRTESPFRGHLRHVVTDTTLGGVELRAGSHLLLSWAAANRDPDVFPDPNAFRLRRQNIRDSMAFGKGIHFCVGAALARLEARVAIAVLLARTTAFRLSDGSASRWVPSIMVRRHRTLRLAVDTSATFRGM